MLQKVVCNKITNWRSAENVRATSCLSCPLTTSVNDMVFSPSSFTSDNFSITFSPYVCMSKGGSESCHLKVIHYLIKLIINIQKVQTDQSSTDAETVSGVTSSSKFCSILCFHVDTRAAISVCFSISLRLATRESWKKNDMSLTKKKKKEVYG